MRLVLLGKPGSGKGTQAKQIAKKFGIAPISTGDLIRRAIADKSELGREFSSYSDRGLLVPDQLVLALVQESLGAAGNEGGFLLDGFPRTVPQAQSLEDWLLNRGHSLNGVLNIVVPSNILVERAVGRRFCVRDGSSYHVKFAPPKHPGICDQCGGALQQRDDDREEVVNQRLLQYEQKTSPLVGFYQLRGKLINIDGVGTPLEVEGRIAAALGSGS